MAENIMKNIRQTLKEKYRDEMYWTTYSKFECSMIRKISITL